jgi:hypothetical protein
VNLRLLFLAALAFVSASPAIACTTPVSVCEQESAGGLGLVRGGEPAEVYIDPNADPAVRHVAADFVEDLGRVAGKPVRLVTDIRQAHGPLVIVGVLGQSRAIDGLVRAHKLDASGLAGKWEAYRQTVVDRPFPNVDRALVITGSDRRGAVFGTYDISAKIGVSPWTWWADVPVERRANLFITAGSRTDGPLVKYRGFFINDEEPSFGGWAREKFGGINSKMYEHVFDLLLRLKGNTLWPAMWGKAFAVDDPQNMVLADSMGVIMGTSHHEPMMRAQDEWHRNTDKGITGGPWDYTTNAANLRAFWRGGIERMASKPGGGTYESLVTIGMRGDGDKPMAQGTAIDLLQHIVADQRKIIADVTRMPASETPQVWALYKEVQDYYDKGMKVPDDVLLLFSDDNWGQIRRLPAIGAARLGGYGIYYHFDYVGGPRSYKWINTNQIEKVWQQMNLAYERGADRLWIVNVGDLKPMEFPLDFFMTMAWNPKAMSLQAMEDFPKAWAAENFGPEHGTEIGELLTTYGRYIARRKPELLDERSFALDQYERYGAEWRKLQSEAEAIGRTLRPDQRDAFFELVEHPIEAMSNLYDLYSFVARNRELAARNDPDANGFAQAAETAFRRDRELAATYHSLAGGKWDHMMDQTHIGYTGWQEPPKDVMPKVYRVAAQARSRPPAPSMSPPSRCVVIDAARYSRAINNAGLRWGVIPNLGHAGAVTAFPQGRPSTSPKDNVRLDYDFDVPTGGAATVQLDLVPTLDVSGGDGIRIGVSLDDRPVQTARLNLVPDKPAWTKAVIDNLALILAPLGNVSAGHHRISIWRLDDNAVLRRLALSFGAPCSNAAD